MGSTCSTTSTLAPAARTPPGRDRIDYIPTLSPALSPYAHQTVDSFAETRRDWVAVLAKIEAVAATTSIDAETDKKIAELLETCRSVVPNFSNFGVETATKEALLGALPEARDAVLARMSGFLVTVQPRLNKMHELHVYLQRAAVELKAKRETATSFGVL
jgi:ABC-type transporter Mla subunit MlaD